MVLISALADALSRKYGTKILPKHIRQVEARALIPAVPRLGPFRTYAPDDAARVERALLSIGRLSAKSEGDHAA